MDNYIATYNDVSDWNFIPYQNTTGSRSKVIVVNPGQEEYFFKGSKQLHSGEIRYPTEFWSEIISSKIGQYLGFDVLDYNIGYNKNGVQKIGCLSKSMVANSSNKLTEGKVYLTGFNPSYDPELDKIDYTFQFICETLGFFSLQNYTLNLLNIIVFDAIIGNSDRHQENWGIITKYAETIKEIDNELLNSKNKLFKKWGLMFNKFLTKIQQDKFQIENVEPKKSDLLLESDIVKNNFSPIYDSGCCLGREKLDNKVEEMLTNKQMIEAYIRKGTSEIHWRGIKKKQNHFDLIKLVSQENKLNITNIIEKVERIFREEDIRNIITNIDSNLPKNLSKHKLSDNRKELMIKLITLRIQKLLELK